MVAVCCCSVCCHDVAVVVVIVSVAVVQVAVAVALVATDTAAVFLVVDGGSSFCEHVVFIFLCCWSNVFTMISWIETT